MIYLLVCAESESSDFYSSLSGSAESGSESGSEGGTHTKIHYVLLIYPPLSLMCTQSHSHTVARTHTHTPSLL